MPNIDVSDPEKASEKIPKKIRKSNKVVTPPDGGFGWVVVFASLIASLLSDGVIYSYGVLATEFMEHFNISRTFIGFMGSTLVAITLAVGPLADFLCDKYGYKFVTIIGTIMSVIGFGSPFFIDNLWFVIAMSSVLTGIGFGLIYFPSLVIINVYFDKKKGLALGIAVCGSGLGAFILSPLIELLIEQYGWKGAMLIVSTLLLNCIPCGLLYRSLTNEENDDSDSDSINSADEETTKEDTEKVTSPLLSVAKDPIFILLCFSNFLTSLGFNAPFIYAKDRAISAGISSTYSSYLISSIGIGNCGGRLLFGFLATLNVVKTFHLYNATIFTCGVALLLSWGARNLYFMLSYTFIFGVASGAGVALVTMILVELFGQENLGASFSLLSIVQGVSVFVGPPLIGAVYDATNSYDAAFAVCGGFLALSGLVMYGAYLSRRFRENMK